jgi:hypothetical protein
MNHQGQIPRSRGGICGVLLILLGLWGGLGPLVGPYFHFGFTPDATWHYDSGRLDYSIIPGAAALLGGLLVATTRNRAIGVAGGLLAALGGAWFVVGGGVVTYVLKKVITAGSPIVTATSGAQPLALRSYLETISLFSGLGVLIIIIGGIAMGRLSMLAASDLAAAADASTYYGDFPSEPGVQAVQSYPASYPAAREASQPDLSQYPTSVGQFGSGTDPAATTTSPGAPGDLFPPAQYPDTTTAHFPPSEPPS